jgi:uncharacterized protein (DUF58 family)
MNLFSNGLRGPFILRRLAHAEGETTLELRQPLVMAACGLALAAYIVWPTAETAMALVTLVLLLVGAFGWARSLARRVRAERRLRYAAVQVGDEVEEELTLQNDTILPVWAEFHDDSNLPGYTLTGVQAADGRQLKRWRVKGTCTLRGVYALGPWDIWLSDPFGVFGVRHRYTRQAELIVYPPLAELPAHLQPRNVTQGDHRLLRQPLRAETINAFTTRPYAPGDPLRHLHWPTTARHGGPYAKVFEPESTSTFWLIPDFDASVQSGDGADSTEETLVLLVTALAAQLLRNHLTVGLLAYTQSLTIVQPQPGAAHLWPILRALAPLHPYPRPIQQTLAEVAPLLSSRARLIVISPALEADWPKALRPLARRDSGAELILLDSASPPAPSPPAAAGGEGAGGEAVARALAEHGISARVVRWGEVKPITAAYGALRRWEFMTLGTGRIVIRQTPRSVREDEPGFTAIRHA